MVIGDGLYLKGNIFKLLEGHHKKAIAVLKEDHIYRHSENAILAFLLLLFTCVNIFNIFHARNIKDRNIKTKVFLIEKIKTEFLAIKRPLPLIPVPL